MSDIKKMILQQMENLGLNIYQVAKIVKDSIPKRTVYAFLTGEKDTSTKTASVIMEALGLTVIEDHNKATHIKDAIMKTEKPKSFRGRVIAEWQKAEKPNWSPRELLGICLLIDMEFKIENLNPSPIFRKHIESNDYSNSLAWVKGLKFTEWK
jgi:hypothetical protein